MVGRQFGSRRLSPAPAMSYNPLDDVPLSIRSGAKSRPSPEGVAPSSAMDFPSQFSDADFEGDSDDSDLGARHSPAPGPAQRQRFSDQLQRHVLWSALGDHIRRRGGADLRASTNRFRAIQSRQAQMPPQGIQREVLTSYHRTINT